MMRRGRSGLVALVAVILIYGVVTSTPAGASAAAGVSAQAPAPVIESAELKLWPEYDDPGLLVIFSGQFAEGTKFPLQAAFPLPSGVRNIQATYQNASGSLINQTFEVKDGKLLYELPSAAFHMEYYLDRAPSGEQRDIKYAFEAPYAINALTVTVQEPARATEFTLNPASSAPQKGTDGLSYYTFNRQNLAAGEKLDIEAKYTKADTGLTAPQLAVAATGVPAQPAPAVSGAAATAGTSSTNWLPWLLIGLGAVLLVAALVYWLLSQRRALAPSPVPASKPRTVQATAPAPPRRSAVAVQPAGEAVSFCTNCGHALKPEDRFCSQCGAPRRA